METGSFDNQPIIRVSGYRPKTRNAIRSAAIWGLEYLVGTRLASNIEIKIEMIDDLKKNEGCLGDCIWDDDNVRPRAFLIRIDSSQTPYTRMVTLFHELIHVKQYATNELFDYQRNLHGAARFRGKIIWPEADRIPYKKLPWEKEANAKEKVVLKAWLDATHNYHLVKQRKEK
jgi:hypothetical protein